MTQPEHTPGPWHAEEHEKAGNLGYKEFYIGADGGYLICNEICNPHDAHLIAALPEMLEALDSAVNFYVSKVTTTHVGEACANGFPLPENIDWSPYVVKAHSAIIKVRRQS